MMPFETKSLNNFTEEDPGGALVLSWKPIKELPTGCLAFEDAKLILNFEHSQNGVCSDPSLYSSYSNILHVLAQLLQLQEAI